MRKFGTVLVVIAVLAGELLAGEDRAIPAAYDKLARDADGSLVVVDGEKTYSLVDETPRYTLRQVRGDPKGTNQGFAFDFNDPANPKVAKSLAGGTLFYALMDITERLPLPKFKRSASIDERGRAHALLTGRLDGKYDFTDWVNTGRGDVYYRVASVRGRILYEGRFSFTGKGPFRVDPGSIIEGPFLNILTEKSVVISFDSLSPVVGEVEVAGVGTFKDAGGTTKHEIEVTGLKPDTVHTYTVSAGGAHRETYQFRTAPAPGSRSKFCFAYASDSRSGIKSGERHIAGVNAYMMKKVAALAAMKGARFMQFTGDEIDGYRNNVDTQRVEFMNWKRSILPFASRMPIVASMGNHEALLYGFSDGSRYGLSCDRFPFETDSAEAIFAEAFVNPRNGPESEDGAAYDPSPDTTDFPSYKENVFSYVYDNVAIVSLNSNYWYAPSVQFGVGTVGGNPHGYLMDKQLEWLEQTLDRLEANAAIDHVFVTQHTPVWPNGGHVADDMWYGGRNKIRPFVAGKPHPKGIIERRDEYWKILMDHPKVYAVLTGDEHNYARLHIKPGMPVYDEKRYVPDEPMEITRAIWQINNGAAGAPYYGLEKAPWNRDVSKTSRAPGEYLKKFTTQNALVLFYIDGKSIRLEVWNPDSLDRIE